MLWCGYYREMGRIGINEDREIDRDNNICMCRREMRGKVDDLQVLFVLKPHMHTHTHTYLNTARYDGNDDKERWGKKTTTTNG